MKVAIAGVGNFGPYLVEEIPKEGHEVVALTRAHKPRLDELGVVQRVTDYSQQSLRQVLEDVDAVVCTLPLSGRSFVDVHLALLEACRAPGARCKRLIVSHWGINTRDVPDQPIMGGELAEEVLAALKAQSEVEWTFVCVGWLADYVLPQRQRHLSDIGEAWPQDYAAKTFTLYGLGFQRVDLTAARDAARATARLFTAAEQGVEWEPFVYTAGEVTTWKGLWEFVKTREPEYTLKTKSLTQSIRQLMDPRGDEMSKVFASFEILGHSESMAMPADKVAAHREKYFKGLKFKTLAELVEEAEAEAEGVVSFSGSDRYPGVAERS